MEEIIWLIVFALAIVALFLTTLSRGPSPPQTPSQFKILNASDATGACSKYSKDTDCLCKISKPDAKLSCADLFASTAQNLPNKCDIPPQVGKTSTCSFYKQYWARVDNRWTAIAIPTTKQRPKKGWPIVTYLMFMLAAGNSDGWGTATPGGLVPTKNIENSRKSLRTVLYTLTQLGYAVLMTSEIASDSYFYAECDSTDLNNICWNDGNNPDLPYFRELFTQIKNNTLIADEKFDYDRFGVIGYSVGAQMVSRFMNNFPLLKLADGGKFPVIKAALMLGGGTMGCYNSTSNLLPCCVDPKCKGRCTGQTNGCLNWCCPSDMSEPNYDSGKIPWSSHPPVLLLQTTNDFLADVYAWSKYFDVIVKNSKNSVELYAIISGGNRHGVCGCQIDPMINFIRSYV
jgi:hypothetical protein